MVRHNNMEIEWVIVTLFYSLLIISNCEIVQHPVSSHKSPLDHSGRSSDVEQPTFWTNSDKYDINPAPCHTACSTPVVEVMTSTTGAFFRSESFKESMYKSCQAYYEAQACMMFNSHCGTDSMFESMTSGLKYMCEEQVEAFRAVVDCIDQNSHRVKEDCDRHCHSNSLAAGLMLKDTVMTQLDHPVVSKNVNMRRIIEPHMPRLFFSESCRIAECVMGCTRLKFNMLCDGTAGSLLMEMLTRPLSEEAEAFPSATYLTSFLGGLLPRTCEFLTSKGRHSFRIDPELDEEIKRMYSEKHRAAGASLPNPLAEPILMDNPFLELPLLLSPVSPIDNPGISALSQISPMRELFTKEYGLEMEKQETSKKLGEYNHISMDELEEADNSTVPDVGDDSNSTVSGTEKSPELKLTRSSRAETDGPDDEYLTVARILTGNSSLSELPQEKDSSDEALLVTSNSSAGGTDPMKFKEGSGESEEGFVYSVDGKRKLPPHLVEGGKSYKIYTVANEDVQGELVCYIEPH
ncbi:unnamed protein product [Cylicocyclus nassatus]|uniref:Chondroitin proteoglycan 4 domain-containing protein n=1 Tax=Cylicocyclus nassatus TaxID=53992 RepID=A0AA36DRD7_CYLNA|nr:unnamed protein product [Cylicocyclus nassatus]